MFFSMAARAQQYEPIRTARKLEKNPQGRVINLPNYDSRLLHFGFFLAINYTTFKVRPSQFFVNQLNDTIDEENNGATRYPFSHINPKGAAGFTTGFIVSMRMTDLWDIRLLPTVSFYQRAVEYTYSHIDTSFFTSSRRSTVTSQLSQNTYSFIELPLLVKYKSVRRQNTRMFVIGGIKPSLEVGAKKKELSDQQLRPNSFDCAVEYGLGIDLYYPLFKFSPEIRFAHGFVNMAVRDNNEFARSIKRMTTHTVTLYLNFN